MKLLRKITSILLCMVLVLPLFSFVSCTGGAVRKALAAIAEQKIAAMGLDLDLSIENTEDGKKDTMGFVLNGMVNIVSEQADLSLVTSETSEGKTEAQYVYAFLRENTLFTTQSENKITNFDGVVLETESIDLNDVSSGATDASLEILESLFEDEDVQSLMREELEETVAFFDFMDVIKGNDKELTIDLNEFLYKLLADCKDVIDWVKSETTLRQILEYKTVKKYGEHFLRDTSAEDLQDGIRKLSEVIKELGGAESDLTKGLLSVAAVPVPKGATTYEYFLELLFSKELENTFRPYGVELNLNEITFADTEEVLKFAFGEEWRKELFKNFEKTTKKEFVLTIDVDEETDGDEVTITLKDCALAIALNKDGSVRSLEVKANMKMTQDTNALSLALKVKQSFFAEVQTLTDIGGGLIETYYIDQPDGVSQQAFHMHLNVDVVSGLGMTSMDYTWYPVYEDGEIVDFQIFFGEEQLETEYDAESGTLTFLSGSEFAEMGLEVTVTVVLYCDIYEYEGSMFIDIFARENANGYAYAMLGKVRSDPITVQEYLTQA